MKKHLKKILLETKIDFSKTVVEISGGSGGVEYFNIKPKDFIRYAKEDLKSNQDSALVNSITNAKRAIDCQIDTVLKTFGIEFDNLPKASEIFINCTSSKNEDLPQKLKLMQSLKVAPGGLTSRARTLRNKLEHYYKVPTKKEIEEAIEIAELFILSCESKTKRMEYEYDISSQTYDNTKIDNTNTYPDRFINCLRFGYRESKKEFTIVSHINYKRVIEVSFGTESVEFYHLIRMLNSLDYKLDFKESLNCLLTYIGHPIPIKNIDIIEMNN